MKKIVHLVSLAMFEVLSSCKCSPYWTAQIENIFIMVESSIGQFCFRDGNLMNEQQLSQGLGFFALSSARMRVLG